MKYIGLDLHKKSIFATVLAEDGKILSRTKIGPTTTDIRYYLKSQGRKEELSVAMEASYNWPYYYRAAEEVADTIVLAHPLKTRIIGEAKIKTDKIDSAALAYMLKADMLPAAYVPSKDTMEDKMLLRARISPIDHKIITGYLDLMDEIGKKIKDTQSQIDKRSIEDPDIELLKTIPGIGTFTAFLVKSEIDDISRFASKGKLSSYAGLIPSTHSSGERLHHGRIVKQGNKFLRWALTEAAQTSVRCSEYFRYHYSRIRSRKSANSATIAVARRMLEIIYGMLKEKREYIEKPVDIK